MPMSNVRRTSLPSGFFTGIIFLPFSLDKQPSGEFLLRYLFSKRISSRSLSKEIVSGAHSSSVMIWSRVILLSLRRSRNSFLRSGYSNFTKCTEVSCGPVHTQSRRIIHRLGASTNIRGCSLKFSLCTYVQRQRLISNTLRLTGT